MDYYFKIGDEQEVGPLALDAVKAALQDGRISMSTPARLAGTYRWHSPSQWPELAQLYQQLHSPNIPALTHAMWFSKILYGRLIDYSISAVIYLFLLQAGQAIFIQAINAAAEQHHLPNWMQPAIAGLLAFALFLSVRLLYNLGWVLLNFKESFGYSFFGANRQMELQLKDGSKIVVRWVSMAIIWLIPTLGALMLVKPLL